MGGGHGAILDHEQRTAFLGLAEMLHQLWIEPAKSGKAMIPERELAVRLIMLIADAPVGISFANQQVARPIIRGEGDGGYTTPAREASLVDIASPRKITECVAESLEHRDGDAYETAQAYAACQRADDDGITYMSCATVNRSLCHDAGAHCFLCEVLLSGPGSAGCMGECGPGCNGIDTYTYDCGDHDRCGRVHGGATNPYDSECGDEYFDADDDFLLATINRC